MSRGPGRIERLIEATFADGPDLTFSTDELAAIAYPGLNRIEKKHRVATVRAAWAVAQRKWWTANRCDHTGHMLVFSNLTSARSMAAASIRRRRVIDVDALEMLLDDPAAGSRFLPDESSMGYSAFEELCR